MFDKGDRTYRNIISNIAILGYSETDIISRGINTSLQLELTCLYSYPYPDENSYNQMTYEMMFPDKNYNIECPKFFSLGLTNELGDRTYLYCLKFPEKYILEINKKSYEIIVPLVLCIKSNKSDLEPFRQLLTSINQIIVSENIDYDPSVVNNYKKVELLNIFYFIFSLPHTPPHSLVRLKLNNDLCEVEKEIDFYFSSNCEIPCNKNDTDINLLFLILDQSIIIKVILAILGEKQIIFRASQAYILHLIIPTFLKLIFPFKWQLTLVTILPNEEAENYLDIPGAYILGILSNAMEIQDIIEKYPGKIVVDYDTNEIFGDEETIPFLPEKNSEAFLLNNRKKKEKDFFNNLEGGIKQGKNLIFVDGSYLYQYDNDKGKGKKIQFEEKNNIIIDTQNSQFLMHKNNDFITSAELKKLRKNIQMVRNPEIFDIENIQIKNKNVNNNTNNKIIKENNSLILPDRPFSYNIQNILLHFYLDKISEKQSKFMEYFKNSNLYLNYMATKKYENNSGKKIIENIKETLDNQRSIDNCFIVEYNKKIFCALSLIDDIIKKIAELKNEEKTDKYFIYHDLKNILIDYCLVLGINNNNNINDSFKQIKNNNNIDIFGKDKEGGLNEININSNKIKINNFKNPKKKGHIKSTSSLLQFTSNQNSNFNLAGIDKSSKDYFKFYKKDGFLNFIKNINEFSTKDGKKLGEIHQQEIYKELFNKYKTLENIFKEESNEEENEIIIDVLNENFEEGEEDEKESENIINLNKDKNKNHNKNPKQLLLEEIQLSSNLNININDSKKLSQIDENEEDNLNINIDNSGSFIEKKSFKNSIDIKDNNEFLGNIILNGFKLGETYMNHSQNEESSNTNVHKSENNIITFPENDNDKDNLNFYEINITKNKGKKNLTQYFLFLASYLEEIYDMNELLDEFNKEMFRTIGTKISLDKLILKFYKEAYKYSGEKHRDFPYFSFYSFLDKLNGKSLIKIEKNLSEEDYNFSELLEIYMYIINKKKIKLFKDDKGNEKLTKRFNTLNEKDNIESLKILDEGIKEERKSQQNTIHFSKSLQINIEKNEKPNNILTEVIIINKDFNPFSEPSSLHILHEFCAFMYGCFPSDEDIKTKSPQQILEQVGILINSGVLKEFLGELKKVDLKQLKGQISKLCFWLNCFNFLLLFYIFYAKPDTFNNTFWENCFKYVQYNIGGNNYSFEDMLYILFKKNIFFPQKKYSPKGYVKKQVVDLSKEKGISQEEVFVSPLLLYLPTKEFYKPIIYEENDIQSQITARLYNNILAIIKWNAKDKILSLSELLIYVEDKFIEKGFQKYKAFIREDVYTIIKKKKYKKMSIKKMNWALSFDNLLKYSIIEE